MRVIQRADSVRVIGDENGFELHVESDEGDRFVFNIHAHAEEFFTNVNSTIGTWLDEVKEARERQPHYRVNPFRIIEEDLDAYPLGDPKRITLEQEMTK